MPETLLLFLLLFPQSYRNKLRRVVHSEPPETAACDEERISDTVNALLVFGHQLPFGGKYPLNERKPYKSAVNVSAEGKVGSPFRVDVEVQRIAG